MFAIAITSLTEYWRPLKGKGGGGVHRLGERTWKCQPEFLVLTHGLEANAQAVDTHNLKDDIVTHRHEADDVGLAAYF